MRCRVTANAVSWDLKPEDLKDDCLFFSGACEAENWVSRNVEVVYEQDGERHSMTKEMLVMEDNIPAVMESLRKELERE